MCGINGVIDSKLSRDEIIGKIHSMNDLIKHRGPDSQDVYFHEGIGLGHTRLSILDLSHNANQPMTSHSGRYVIVYNGEIYNFVDLMAKLQKDYKIKFKTNSDTEVLVNLIECLGIKNALDCIEGMFAFAVLDKKENILYLSRDRFGEKPLYWFQDKSCVYFSSEMSPLMTSLKSRLTINYESVSFFLKKSYIPTDKSIFNEIKKVKPGTYLEIPLKKNSSYSNEFKYWDYKKVALKSVDLNKHSITSDVFYETKSQLSTLLESKIKNTMISDVPLGAFLSGGYDSSCVVAFMQKNSMEKIKTFSIGFEEAQFNEADHAKDISSHLGTEHQELYLSKKDLLDTISILPDIYTEPFADSSQIPTLLLSKLTKSQVTVSLSGDGGDEIFGGYGKYFLGEKVKQSLGRIPLGLREILNQSNSLYLIKPLLKLLMSNSINNIDQKFIKLQKILNYSSDHDLFSKLSQFDNSFVLNDKPISLDPEIWKSNHSFFRKAMISDAIDYLPGDILTKVDIAGMSVSLESRIPLLNHKIAEFAASIPQNFLLNNGSGKYILKEVVHDLIPKKLMDRPKKGFDIPLSKYLRNELRDYTESTLDHGRKHFSDVMDFSEIDSLWSDHVNYKIEEPNLIWNLTTLFAWHEKHI